MWFKDSLHIQTRRQGLHDITAEVQARLAAWKLREGMCFLYLQHTSASLCISENYDPTAKQDLETFLTRIAPEGERWHVHTLEGSDDSPSHMRSIITGVSLQIPVDEGQLALGTWQGIYLCEHRRAPHRRTVLLRGLSVDGMSAT
jgi:secondary thiamine-phosphate synthase enzyme